MARIVEVPGKGLTVFGPGRLSFVSVPSSLDGFEEARVLLVSWRTPESRRGGGLGIVVLVLSLLAVIAAMGLVIGSSDKLLVTSLGLGLIGVMLYGFVALYRSPQFDARTKKAAWFIPFAILALALRIWVVWQG